MVSFDVHLHASVGSLALVLSASPACAQDVAATEQAAQTDEATNSGGLGEIIVTAQRRAERLQDIPVSIAAVTQDRIASANTVTIASLPALVPTLNVQDSIGFVQPYIRGVGSTNVAPGTYSSVAIYVDGLYTARLTSGNFDLDNIASVQVLNGPQGALYGRNATAGAILVTTETGEPGQALTGRFAVAYGNYNDINVTGTVSGGLGDKLGFSLSASRHTRDGFLKNRNPAGFHKDDGDNRNTWGVAGKLKWTPSSSYEAIFSAGYTWELDRAGIYVQADTQLPGPVAGLNNSQTAIFGTLLAIGFTQNAAYAAASSAQYPTGFRDFVDPTINAFERGLFKGPHMRGGFLFQEDFRASVTQVFHAATFDVTSLSGYTASKTNAAAIVTNEIPLSTGLPTGLGTSLLADSKTYQQDLYASSTTGTLKWLVGGSFFREDGSTKVAVDFPVNISALINDARFRDVSWAGYAQVTVPLTDTLRFTAGGRYTTERYSIDDRINTATTGVPNFGQRGQTYNKATYAARLEYKPSKALLVYGGVSSGFKSGTLNVSNPAGGETGPESLVSYEIGFKSDLAGNRVRLNGAAFYYDYTNIQTFQIVNGSGFLLGGLDGRVYGAELSLEAHVSDNLELGSAGSILDAKYTSDTLRPDGVFYAVKGNRLAGSSKFSGNIYANYTVPLADDASIKANVTLSYNSGFWFEPLNAIGTGGNTDKSFTLLNARIMYTLPGGKLSVSAYGSNLLGEDYYRAGVLSSDISRTVNPSAPTQYGVRVGYKF